MDTWQLDLIFNPKLTLQFRGVFTGHSTIYTEVDGKNIHDDDIWLTMLGVYWKTIFYQLDHRTKCILLQLASFL